MKSNKQIWKYNTYTGKPIYISEKEPEIQQMYCEQCGKKSKLQHLWTVGQYSWLCEDCSSFYNVMHKEYPTIYP